MNVFFFFFFSGCEQGSSGLAKGSAMTAGNNPPSLKVPKAV